MNILTNANTDKLQMTTSSAADLDVVASFVDLNADGSGDPSSSRQLTAFSSATTLDILATPGSSKVRNATEITARNKHASLAVDVTAIYNNNGTSYEIGKWSLDPGDILEYIEGVGWFVVRGGLLDIRPTFTTTDQSIGASVTVYFTNSGIAIPAGRPIQIGTIFDWRIVMTKTAAGTAAATFNVRLGTNGSTADTSLASLSTGTQSAAADTMVAQIRAMVRGPLSASGIVHCMFNLAHNLAATGFGPTANIIGQANSAAFNLTTAGLVAGVSITTGASHSYTVQEVSASVVNL